MCFFDIGSSDQSFANTTMSRLNMQVDRDHRTPAQVADAFLRR